MPGRSIEQSRYSDAREIHRERRCVNCIRVWRGNNGTLVIVRFTVDDPPRVSKRRWDDTTYYKLYGRVYGTEHDDDYPSARIPATRKRILLIPAFCYFRRLSRVHRRGTRSCIISCRCCRRRTIVVRQRWWLVTKKRKPPIIQFRIDRGERKNDEIV